MRLPVYNHNLLAGHLQVTICAKSCIGHSFDMPRSNVAMCPDVQVAGCMGSGQGNSVDTDMQVAGCPLRGKCTFHLRPESARMTARYVCRVCCLHNGRSLGVMAAH